MKALLLGLFLAQSAPVLAADAVKVPEITGVLVYEVDHKPMQLAFIYADGSAPLLIGDKDCLEAPACKAEVQHLLDLHHVGIIDVSTGTEGELAHGCVGAGS